MSPYYGSIRHNPTGIASLRSALRRARKAGARVEPIANGSLRISHPLLDGSVRIHESSREASRELMGFVAALESIPKRDRRPPVVELPPMPVENAPQAHETPEIVNKRRGNISSQVREYLRSKPADADGWIRFDGAPEVTQAIGAPKQQTVSAALAYLKVARHAEFRFRGKSYTHIRFLDEPLARTQVEADELNGDAPNRVVLKGVALVPDTPHLANYANAQLAAKANKLLMVAHLSDSQKDELISEALRLYHWLRASQR